MNALLLLCACFITSSTADWTGWGGGDFFYDHEWNVRASDDIFVNSSSIDSWVYNCRIDYPLGISSSPTVTDHVAFFPTWNGSFVALDTRTCAVIWSLNVTDIIYTAADKYEGIVPPSAQAASFIPAVSSTTPQAELDSTLYFGTQLGALLVAVLAATGEVYSVVQLDSHPFAVVTMSPSYYDGSGGRESDPNAEAHLLVLVGTDSMELTAAKRVRGYRCCTFVGRMFAYQSDGFGLKQLWNVSMIPDALARQGWSGVPLFGSQPAVALAIAGQDIKSKDVFIATGSAYTRPRSVTSCYHDIRKSTTTSRDPCLPRQVFEDSVLHLNVDTGAIVWVRQLTPINARAAICGNETSKYTGYGAQNQASCKKAPSLYADAAFGMAPSIVLRIRDVTPGINSKGDVDVIYIGQKNGNLYAFEYDTGVTLWATNVGVWGAAAELSGGIAIDDRAIYYTQQWRKTSGRKTSHGSAYGAADISNGTSKWVVPVPHGAAAYNPPTVVGDIVLTGYFDYRGRAASRGGALVALNKTTGQSLKQFKLDSVFTGGIAVDNGQVLFGTGDLRPDAKGSFLVAQVT